MQTGKADGSSRYTTYLHLAIIIIMGIIVYSNTFDVPFQFDDKPNIVENPAIKSSKMLLDALCSQSSVIDPLLRPQIPSRIFGYFTFFLNYKIHGLSLAGYHAVNLAIHLINALLVFLITSMFYTQGSDSGSASERDDSRLVPFLCALLFVIHPIQTQAVTYIVQRFTSLATMLSLLTVASYLKARFSKSSAIAGGYYACSLVAALCAMKTKEFAFLLPIILTLVERLFIKDRDRKGIRRLLPFYLLAAVIPLTIMLATRGAATAVPVEYGSSSDVSRWQYFITELTVIVKYLGLLVPPVIQNLDYDYPVYRSFFEPKVIGSAVFLLALAGAGVYSLRAAKRDAWYSSHARMCGFGIFWFFITISAESSFIKIKDLVFEHRMYLPSVGIFLAASAAAALAMKFLERRKILLDRVVLPSIILLVVVVTLSFATYTRNMAWQREIWLWQDTVAKSPNKPRPHNNLALAYADAALYDKAIEENLLSLKLKPDSNLHVNVGNLYLSKQNFLAAMKEFEAAIALKPDNEKAYLGISNALYRQQRRADAIQACSTALKLKKDYAPAYNMLGVIALDQGETEAALKEFNQAIACQPDFAVAHNNAGNANFKLKKYEAAIAEYGKVSELDPSYIGVRLSKGRAYHELGQYKEAINEYREALAMKPDYAEAKRLMDASTVAMKGTGSTPPSNGK